MKYQDFKGNPIKPGFYFETFHSPEYKSKDKEKVVFYTGEDEFRNRIVQIARFKGFPGLYVVLTQGEKPTPLNPNYSRWLSPPENQRKGLLAKLKGQK